MWDLAVREEDWESASGMLRRYRGSPPPSYALVLSRAQGDSAAEARALEEALAVESRQLQIAARYVATYLNDFARADELLRLELGSRRRPAIRQDSHLLAGWLEIARGRWTEALAAWSRAEGEGAPGVVVHRAMAATLPFFDVPAPGLLALRSELEAWQPDKDPDDRSAVATALRPHLRLYLQGLVESKLDRGTEALALASAIERLPAPGPGRSVVSVLAQVLRADVAWRAGRADATLAELDRTPMRIPLDFLSLPTFAIVREYGGDHGLYLRAAALTRLGRDAEARRWLELGFVGAPHEAAFEAARSRLLSEVLVRLGDRAGAQVHGRRAVALWEAGDPPQRKVSDELRRRLEAGAAAPRP